MTDPSDFYGLPNAAELTKLANEMWVSTENPQSALPPMPELTGATRPTIPEVPVAPQVPEAPAYVPASMPAGVAVPTDQAADEKNVIRVAVRNGAGTTEADSLHTLSESVTGEHTHRNDGITIGSKTLQQIRDDFPILQEQVGGFPLVWLDNGATTQKPQAVIDRLTLFYTHENSNVHRGAHELAARSTDAYEGARQIVADFIGAPDKDDIVFVRGTTEGINLVANAFVKPRLAPGDEIILTILEHHANIVPWQLIAAETGAVLKVVPCDDSGQLVLSEYEKLFTPHTRFVSATQVSNVLGTVTPVEELVTIAHRHGVPILIDGAQSVAHMPVNVGALDADFFVFSGHKIFAPTGIGAVYGKKALLDAAQPYHGGGNMIKDVTFERTIYNPAPNKFEAGTGSIADAVGLGTALQYLSSIGMPAIHQWEQELIQYGMKELARVPGLHLLGTAPGKSSALSFKLDGYEDGAVGEYLNRYGIAVRTGHHCAQPVLRRFGLESVVRPTIALYNSPDDIDALVRALRGLA
ncbi:MAG: cysteine desulfurase [Lachnospiraceae bacterium]|nr:cysteine desulfurase [Lachnospiraceae bacterium]